jgi:hypothetical protein
MLTIISGTRKSYQAATVITFWESFKLYLAILDNF